MTGPAGRGAVLWVLVLLAAATTVLLGAGQARARAATPTGGFCLPAPCPTTPTTTGTTTSTTSATSSTTSSSTSTTAPPTTVANSPYSVGFVPCGSGSGGPCTQEPGQVELRYTGTTPAAVQLLWKSDGRAPSAPGPAATSATMLWSDGSACGTGLRCWQWPAQMTDSGYILNGTYQMDVCDTYTQGSCRSTSPPVSIGLAAPPGPPTRVQARASGRVVTVSWDPPAGAPPDLTGYTVTRNGRPAYSCSTDGLGPAGSVRCPTPLTLADQPGNGSFTYSVTALRLGVDTNQDSVVASSPAGAGGPVGVAGQVTTAPASGATGGGRPASFLPSPVIGGPGVLAGPGAPVPVAGTGTPAEAAAGGPPQNLQYPSSDAVVGNSAMEMRLRGAGKADVVPAGMLALGVLILAVAAHVLYLRARLGVVQARLGAAGGQR